MEKTINSIKIKLGDSFYIDRKFTFEDQIQVLLKGEIVKRDVGNNQDGTVDLTFHFKAFEHDITLLEE